MTEDALLPEGAPILEGAHRSENALLPEGARTTELARKAEDALLPEGAFLPEDAPIAKEAPLLEDAVIRKFLDRRVVPRGTLLLAVNDWKSIELFLGKLLQFRHLTILGQNDARDDLGSNYTPWPGDPVQRSPTPGSPSRYG